MLRRTAHLLIAALSLPLCITACSEPSSLEVSPDQVDFGTVEPDAFAYGLVELWNPASPLVVTVTVQPRSGIFSSPGEAVRSLDAGSLTEIEVQASGTEPGTYQGVLTILWDGGSAEVLLYADVEYGVIDLDRDGFPAGEDCDDTNPAIRPGAEELCDGLDGDCDGELPADEADLDGDGQAECSGDCDDSEPTVAEQSVELCDGLDNDCNGLTDFDDAGEVDADGDGSLSCEDCDDDPATGAANSPANAEICDGADNDCNGSADADAAGEVDFDADGSLSCLDCDDADASRAPGAVELCDGIDNDCNGLADADAAGESDADGDGSLSCEDCDDDDALVSPGTAEACDGIDNDCNGVADADAAGEVDADADGSLSCADCNDAESSNFPSNLELCDGVDNDCNGVADADGAGEVDADADGSLSCIDCDDNSSANFPGNLELCDGADNDCNGSADADAAGELDGDGDGFLSCADCDDGNAQISPNATEVCDAVDNDCDGSVDENAVLQEFFLKGINQSEVEFWLSDGNGSFSNPLLFNPTGSGAVRAAVAGDFDGDGHQDFFLGTGSNARVHLYRSDCEGGFDVLSQDYAGALRPVGNAHPHAAADLDLDGDLDVLGWDWTDGEGWVWLNDGDGVTWTRLPAASNGTRPFDLQWSPNNSGFREVVALPPVDMTGDGIPDLVECVNISSGGIGLAASSCQIHSGVGDGNFTSTFAPEFGVLRRINGMALADFDGDGDIDMLGGLDDDGDAGQVWYWSGGPIYPGGLGSEAFDVNEAFGSGINDQDEPGYGWMSPYDWNGDGAMDVLVSYMDPHNSGDRTLVVAINDGNANFTLSAVGNSQHAYAHNHNAVQDVISVPVYP